MQPGDHMGAFITIVLKGKQIELCNGVIDFLFYYTHQSNKTIDQLCADPIDTTLPHTQQCIPMHAVHLYIDVDSFIDWYD